MENGNSKKLKILYLEDNPLDVEMIREILDEAFCMELVNVDNPADFRNHLTEDSDFDVILSDFKLPSFSANEALEMARKLLPDIPFICVSGTIGEERAVSLLQKGAVDYVLKDRPKRLSEAVLRAIRTADEAKALALAQERLKQQNRELIAARDRAEESDRLKSAFLANMSHEIRTPMNGIIGFSELLLSVNDDHEKQERYSQIIRNSCEQLLSLIDGILDFSLIESNKLVLRNKVVNIGEVFQYLYSLYEVRCKEKGIQLVQQKVEDNIQLMSIDESRLIQVFCNLLSNALKFTESGTICFGVGRCGSKIRFYVSDTGLGISQNDQEIIFDRFRQAGRTQNKFYGGSGLGLSISKSLVEAMGGVLQVDSVLDKGSTFYFTFSEAIMLE